MIYYVQIEESTNNVLGYSSNKMHDTDVQITELDIDTNFLNIPLFYKYNLTSKKIEYSEDLSNLYNEKKNNKPIKPEDMLLKQMADIKVDIMSKNSQINKLTSQLADIKIDGMKKDTIINNLVSQMAASKLENMKMKGSN